MVVSPSCSSHCLYKWQRYGCDLELCWLPLQVAFSGNGWGDLQMLLCNVNNHLHCFKYSLFAVHLWVTDFAAGGMACFYATKNVVVVKFRCTLQNNGLRVISASLDQRWLVSWWGAWKNDDLPSRQPWILQHALIMLQMLRKTFDVCMGSMKSWASMKCDMLAYEARHILNHGFVAELMLCL